HVLHAPAEHGAHEDPDGPRQEPELHGQRRADEGPWTRDGREVMAEDDPAVGGDEVAAVVEAFGGRGARGVQRKDPGRDPGAVEAVTDEVDAGGGDDEPDGAQAFAPVQGDAGEGPDADDHDRRPDRPCHGGLLHGSPRMHTLEKIITASLRTKVPGAAASQTYIMCAP